jgi:hypothetical protein
VPTRPVSVIDIMRTRAFADGFAAARAGRPFDPDYATKWLKSGRSNRQGTDLVDVQWDYERGRHVAMIAPRRMPLHVNGRLNPALIRIADDVII